MLFKSEIVTQVSGSIGGTTYSHNSAGMYRRARTIPVNPNSTDQQAVRNILTDLAQNWNNVLNSGQRGSWDNYAANSPVTGKFGDDLLLSGQQMYIRCNSVRMRSGIAVQNTAPITAGLTTLTMPVATVSVAAADISIAYTAADAWANEVGGGLNIQTSRVLSGGINFWRGPNRQLITVPGAAAPPTSPESQSNNAFGQSVTAYNVGQKIYLRYVAFLADGRLSAAMTELVDVTA